MMSLANPVHTQSDVTFFFLPSFSWSYWIPHGVIVYCKACMTSLTNIWNSLTLVYSSWKLQELRFPLYQTSFLIIVVANFRLYCLGCCAAMLKGFTKQCTNWTWWQNCMHTFHIMWKKTFDHHFNNVLEDVVEFFFLKQLHIVTTIVVVTTRL